MVAIGQRSLSIVLPGSPEEKVILFRELGSELGSGLPLPPTDTSNTWLLKPKFPTSGNGKDDTGHVERVHIR